MATPSATPAAWHRKPALLLAAGIALVVLTHLRWGIGPLAWVAPVPFLRYLRVTGGWRSRAWLVAALLVAWIGATLKIVTPPLPPVFALPVGGGLGAVASLAYLGWDLVRRRIPTSTSIVAFAAWATAVEWLQHRATPLGSWGAAAYTQVENLPLLQVAALAGMAGVSFLVSWAAAWLEAAASARLDGLALPWRHGLALAVVLTSTLAYGVLRLDQAVPGERVRVAAVGTTATFTGFPIPTRAERDRQQDQLFADTERAADAGARLAVWTEASSLVEAGPEEAGLLARGLEVARRRHLELVMAYIVPRSEQPLSIENKYAWASPDGLRQTYYKHHPAPGEPAVAGTDPLEAVEVPWGRAGGALCYDYDYPALSLEQARLGIGLVALPSSDWRGIDPIHTQMAALRAIEGGLSVVRSTRFGLSGAIDARGRFRAWTSSFDGGDRLMVADLPAQQAPTLYARIGDLLAWACLAGVVALGLVSRLGPAVRRLRERTGGSRT